MVEVKRIIVATLNKIDEVTPPSKDEKDKDNNNHSGFKSQLFSAYDIFALHMRHISNTEGRFQEAAMILSGDNTKPTTFDGASSQ